MRLDFLQNYPSNHQANKILISPDFPNPSPINPKDYATLKQEEKNLASIFNANSVIPFGFGHADWLELFLNLTKSYKPAFTISNHQQAYQAFKTLDIDMYRLIPDKTNAQICTADILEAIHNKCNCFIIPLINQDILTLNPLAKIRQLLKESLQDFILIVDISYGLSLQIDILDILDEHTLLLINGESLGILRGNGVIISRDFLAPEVLPKSLPNQNLFKSFLHAFNNPIIQIQEDSKIRFYQYLKDELKQNLALFAPLQNTPPNTLPLRFDSIKARNLLQALLLQKIHAINGAECLYGFSKPSFVLQEMGYSQLEARELISLSYHCLPNLEATAKALCDTYRQIRTLEI